MKTMNTKQLVALWYTVLSIVIILIAFANANQKYSLYILIISCLLIGSLFIYSFAEHPNANKLLVLLSVSVPSLILSLFIYTLSISSENENSRYTSRNDISSDQVEIFDTQLTPSFGRSADFTGRVKNNSDKRIKSITFRINVYGPVRNIYSPDSSEVIPIYDLIDGSRVYISFINSIPPGKVQSFNETAVNLDFPNQSTWDYELLSVN